MRNHVGATRPMRFSRHAFSIVNRDSLTLQRICIRSASVIDEKHCRSRMIAPLRQRNSAPARPRCCICSRERTTPSWARSMTLHSDCFFDLRVRPFSSSFSLRRRFALAASISLVVLHQQIFPRLVIPQNAESPLGARRAVTGVCERELSATSCNALTKSLALTVPTPSCELGFAGFCPIAISLENRPFSSVKKMPSRYPPPGERCKLSSNADDGQRRRRRQTFDAILSFSTTRDRASIDRVYRLSSTRPPRRSHKIAGGIAA